MILTSKFPGLISLAVGILMCLPALGLGAAMVLFHQHDLGGISMSVAGGGTISLSAGQAWAILCGLALLGIGFIVFGIYALSSSGSES